MAATLPPTAAASVSTMQQIGTLVPFANHQFPKHSRWVWTAGGGRSNYVHLVMPHGQAYLHQHQVKVAPRASNPLQAVTTVNTNQDSNIRKEKYFEVEMEVHDTELDQYGVVNNAIYSSYIQNGHEKLLESLGISVDSMVSEGNALALSEVHLKFIAPLRVWFANAEHNIENLGPLMLNLKKSSLRTQ
uniref:Uncharacterized protein n=1 Tax=Avena sativa TaxID=4498 RepID=A0ACD6AP39_AVESA